jgi:hypothetical protein
MCMSWCSCVPCFATAKSSSQNESQLSKHCWQSLLPPSYTVRLCLHPMVDWPLLLQCQLLYYAAAHLFSKCLQWHAVLLQRFAHSRTSAELCCSTVGLVRAFKPRACSAG